MNFARHTALLSASLLMPIAALADEAIVTIPSEGSELVATLQTPDGDPAPVVLLLHGFTGVRDELKSDAVPDGVFAYTADKLEEAGLASLRVDFRGSGESTADLSFADTTFEGQIADALASIDYLEGSDAVAGPISVIGWSQGGLVAASAAGRSDDVDALVLWNAVANPMETFGSIFGEALDPAIAAEADETLDLTLPWGAEVALKGAFFDEVAAFDPTKELMGYSGPLLVAQGNNDTTVLPASADAFLDAHDGPEAKWTADMDHVFNIFATDADLAAMIDGTIAFLKDAPN